MKKESIVVGVVFILVLTGLSGCNEQSSNGNDQDEIKEQDISNAKVVYLEIKSRITIENENGTVTYEDEGFRNKWEQYDEGLASFEWTFNGDGSLEIMGFEIGSWSVKDNKVCLRADEVWEYIPQGSSDEICYNFEFSDGGNTLTLSIEGSDLTVLTKK